jgi:hypothetical protein
VHIDLLSDFRDAQNDFAACAAARDSMLRWHATAH